MGTRLSKKKTATTARKPAQKRPTKPAADSAPPGLGRKQIETMVSNAAQAIDKQRYVLPFSEVLRQPDVASLLGLKGPDRREALLALFQALGGMARSRGGSVRREHDWLNIHREKGFRPVAILIGKMLRAAPPFEASDWRCVLEEVASFEAISVRITHDYLDAMVRQLERFLEQDGGCIGEVAPPLTLIMNALRHLSNAPEGRVARRIETLLTRHGLGAAPAAKSSALEGVLLDRECARVDDRSSFAELLAGTMVVPSVDERESVVRFATDSIAGLSEVVEAINGVLAAASPAMSHDGLRDEDIAALRRVTRPHGLRAVAVIAGAAAAMSQKPIKMEFGNRRAERFHNGSSAMLIALPVLLHETKGNDAEGLSEVAHAISRYKLQEYAYPDWIEVTRSITSRAADLLGDRKGRLDRALAIRLLRFRERMARSERMATRAAVQGFDAQLGIGIGFPVDLGERWTDRMYQDVRGASRAWRELLRLCAESGGTTPSAKWLTSAGTLLAKLEPSEVQQRLAVWLGLVGRARPLMEGGKVEGRDSSVPSDRGAELLRGLAFVASRFDTAVSARALGDLAMASYKMVPGVGARCIKPGTSAVWALSQLTTPEALAQLSRVRQLVKFGTAKRVLDTALSRLSAARGVTTDELHEMAAPDFGLDVRGVRSEVAGEYTLELRASLAGTQVTVLAGGVELKSVPAGVKRDHAEVLKGLKLAAADIDKMLPAQKDRIERLYHSGRTWDVGTWRRRYLDHPLVGVLARRLIWSFQRDGSVREGIWHDGGLVDERGKGIEVLESDAVRLWHPIGARIEQVRAWRAYLEDNGVRQPFKQAHREVYLLTDAEARTETYSNRFAAHIIKQNQLTALCQARGWAIKMFVLEYGESPRLWLPNAGLFAHFEVLATGDEYYGSAGASSYLQTDRVRFTRTPEGEDIRVDQVPPLVFSEVMRDVDLFVGVCSVGNNPQWSDGGPGGTYREYWHGFSFGELSETGAGRKELLGRLLPRLKIAGVCELRDRFLVVKGKLRTYKIHLGSGNILMEPNDQYLCIVPGGRDEAAGTVFLPYEGDRTLAIILSKAMMLAEDDQIKDQSVVRQIR